MSPSAVHGRSLCCCLSVGLSVRRETQSQISVRLLAWLRREKLSAAVIPDADPMRPQRKTKCQTQCYSPARHSFAPLMHKGPSQARPGRLTSLRPSWKEMQCSSASTEPRHQGLFALAMDDLVTSEIRFHPHGHGSPAAVQLRKVSDPPRPFWSFTQTDPYCKPLQH
ncbi:hypothetical protein LZ31DRAFT_347645 [Colletotrichum somersetense]|nr:hypothetical protein LZ31DRAFT_347645 [Colletotrichum somersetense]